MQTFITFMFWLYVVSVALRVLLIFSEHPREAIVSIEMDVTSFLISVALLFWIAFLKFSS